MDEGSNGGEVITLLGAKRAPHEAQARCIEKATGQVIFEFTEPGGSVVAEYDADTYLAGLQRLRREPAPEPELSDVRKFAAARLRMEGGSS